MYNEINSLLAEIIIGRKRIGEIMFNVLVGLQIFSILMLVCSLVYIFRGNTSYTRTLMFSFTIAELVHNAGYLLELFASNAGEAILAVKVEY